MTGCSAALDTEGHEIFLPWRYRMGSYHSHFKGWKVSPSHCINQDLATIWLDKISQAPHSSQIRRGPSRVAVRWW
jgi:hypothetical protein